MSGSYSKPTPSSYIAHVASPRDTKVQDLIHPPAASSAALRELECRMTQCSPSRPLIPPGFPELEMYERAPSWDHSPLTLIDAEDWDWGLKIPPIPLLDPHCQVHVRDMESEALWSPWKAATVVKRYVQQSFINLKWDSYQVRIAGPYSYTALVTPHLGELKGPFSPVGEILPQAPPNYYASLFSLRERVLRKVFVHVKYVSRATRAEARVWCSATVNGDFSEPNLSVTLTDRAFHGLECRFRNIQRVYQTGRYVPYTAQAAHRLRELGECIGPGSDF